MGDEDKMKRYKGKPLPTVMWPGEGTQPAGDGGGSHSEGETGAVRVARQDEASTLVCDPGRGPGGAGQSSGARGARVNWVPAREHPDCWFL